MPKADIEVEVTLDDHKPEFRKPFRTYPTP